MKNKISSAQLKDRLCFNKETGVFTRKTKINASLSEMDCGTVNKGGYRVIYVLGGHYYAHRLAWLYCYGDWPKHTIDHINGDCLDNRIVNLRDVPHQDNCKNLKLSANNTSGHTGVSFDKKLRKFRVNITINGRTRYGGLFADIGEAIKRRKKLSAENNYHPNHGGR